MDLVPKWFNRFPRPTFGKFFDDLEGELSPLFSRWSGLSVSSDESHIFVEAHVPGLSVDNIDVSVDSDHVLWIKGEKKEIEEDKKKKYYRRSQSEFSYCLPLSEEIDFEKEPEATCKDGMMRVSFAKRKETSKEIKKIQVKKDR